jgi:hypothetical protein
LWNYEDEGQLQMMLEVFQHLHRLLGPLELVLSFSNLKKGNPCSPRFEMYLFRAVIQPVSFWTSLIIREAPMSVLAVIFFEFASIPQ